MASFCPGQDTPEAAQNRETEKLLQEEAMKDRMVHKLLLLGAGGSGKSTIFKQMKIINDEGYSEEEMKVFANVVRINIYDIFSLILFMCEEQNLVPGSQHETIIKALKEQNSKNFELDESRVQMLKAFFNDGAVQTALKKRNKYDLNDNYEYFVNNLERFARSDYRPTLDDVLRTRLKTVGIVERDFNMKGKQGDQSITFKLVDVGGQRNERRKWIHAFSNVTLIMFVASLSEYDQVLAEDSDVNRMKESLDLFEFICTHESFYDRRRNQAKGIILFLNKRDLFEEKLKVKPITECAQFQSYTGDNSYKQCYEYIEEQYRKKNPHSFRSIYPHATCATDTGTMRHVFDSCRAAILQAILSATRML